MTRPLGVPDAGGSAAAVRIRAATPADGRAIAALMAGVYAEDRWFVGDGPPSGEAMARRLRAMDPKREVFLVAEAGAGRAAELAGWIELHRYVPRRLDHVASLTIAVAEGMRRRGIGRRLMRAVLPWARRVGVRKIRLDVRAGNEAAIALYEAEGFVREGLERAQVRSGADFEDNVLMARFLVGADGKADADAEGDARR
jgi:RimJ/RimL family protein N-acetyltransferase